MEKQKRKKMDEKRLLCKSALWEKSASEFWDNVRSYRIHSQAELFEILFGKVTVFICKRNALRLVG